jgi:DNA-binding beta-propeller fold protein YncE
MTRKFSAAALAVLAVALSAPAAELELVQTLQSKGKAGGLDHVALDTKRGHLLLANKANNTLDFIDLKDGKLIKQKDGQTAIQGVTYVADFDRIFVGLGTGGLCNVINPENYNVVKSFNFKDDADNVRYNPVAKVVYVAHAEKALGVIDAQKSIVKTDIKLPAGAESFVIEAKRPRMYLVTPSPCQMVVIDTDKNAVDTTYPIKSSSGAHTIALDEANHRVFIGCHKEPMMVVLDTETGKEVATVPLPGDNDDLWFDAKTKRLYASCGEGALVVLEQRDADQYKVLEKIDTVKGARTCFYDPESKRLYLAVPRKEGKEGPEVRVYQAKP